MWLCSCRNNLVFANLGIKVDKPMKNNCNFVDIHQIHSHIMKFGYLVA
jgi:hypothetical protein